MFKTLGALTGKLVRSMDELKQSFAEGYKEGYEHGFRTVAEDNLGADEHQDVERLPG